MAKRLKLIQEFAEEIRAGSLPNVVLLRNIISLWNEPGSGALSHIPDTAEQPHE